MNLPTRPEIAQKRAQKSAVVFSVSRGATPRATVCVPALVPSFKRAGGNVTCYPSPSKRPVGLDGGPSFLRGWPRHPEKEPEEVRASCRKSNSLPLAQLRPRACRAVSPQPTLTAPLLARLSAVSAQQPWAAVSLPASLPGLLLARFVTKCLRSATDLIHRGPASARSASVLTGPSGADCSGWSFFVFTPAAMARA